jgi:hypothetical protein
VKGKGRTGSTPPATPPDLLPGYDADLHRLIHENERESQSYATAAGVCTESLLDNVQLSPLYPVRTSPSVLGDGLPRRSAGMTLSRTSASRGAVLSGSFTRRGTASRWRFPSAPSSRQSSLMLHLAPAWPRFSFPNLRSSIWRTSRQIPRADPRCAPGSAVRTGPRECRPRKFFAMISLALPCSLRMSFEIFHPLPARTFACVVPPTYGQNFFRHILWITTTTPTRFLCLPVSRANTTTTKATVRPSAAVAVPSSISLGEIG